MLRKPGLTLISPYLIRVTYYVRNVKSHCSNHLDPIIIAYQHSDISWLGPCSFTAHTAVSCTQTISNPSGARAGMWCRAVHREFKPVEDRFALPVAFPGLVRTNLWTPGSFRPRDWKPGLSLFRGWGVVTGFLITHFLLCFSFKGGTTISRIIFRRGFFGWEWVCACWWESCRECGHRVGIPGDVGGNILVGNKWSSTKWKLLLAWERRA